MALGACNKTLETIFEQVDWRELRMGGFKFVCDNDKNTAIINKGTKTLAIHYDEGMDTYNVKKYSKGEEIGSTSDAMWEDLKPAVSEFFKFEYVMGRFRRD